MMKHTLTHTHTMYSFYISINRCVHHYRKFNNLFDCFFSFKFYWSFVISVKWCISQKMMITFFFLSTHVNVLINNSWEKNKIELRKWKLCEEMNLTLSSDVSLTQYRIQSQSMHIISISKQNAVSRLHLKSFICSMCVFFSFLSIVQFVSRLFNFHSHSCLNLKYLILWFAISKQRKENYNISWARRVF